MNGKTTPLPALCGVWDQQNPKPHHYDELSAAVYGDGEYVVPALWTDAMKRNFKSNLQLMAKLRVSLSSPRS